MNWREMENKKMNNKPVYGVGGGILNNALNSATKKPASNTGNKTPSNNNTGSGSITGGQSNVEIAYGPREDRYDSSYDDYASILAQQKAAQQAAANEAAKGQISSASQAAADARTNAYLQNLRGQSVAGQQASLMGLGGLSESNVTDMQARYGTGLSEIDKSLAGRLADIEGQRAQGQIAADGDYASKLAEFELQRYNREQQQADALARQTSTGGTTKTTTRSVSDIKNMLTMGLITEEQAREMLGLEPAPQPDTRPAPEIPTYNSSNSAKFAMLDSWRNSPDLAMRIKKALENGIITPEIYSAWQRS